MIKMWPVFFLVLSLATPSFTLFGTDNHRENRVIYPYYKMIEEALTEDWDSLFLMRQVYLPAETEQPWLIDGVQNIYFKFNIDHNGKCGSDDDGNGSTTSSRQSWEFRWTDSSLLSMVSPDALLAFDPVFVSITFSAILHSPDNRGLALTASLNGTVPNCNTTQTEVVWGEAAALFLSWGKAYAKSNGKPPYWDEKDKGYVARWYSYYATGSAQSSKYYAKTHQSLLIIFIFLNILLPIVFLNNSSHWAENLTRHIQKQPESISTLFWAIGAIFTIYNTFYLIAMILIHSAGYPNALWCVKSLHCSIPQSEYERTYTLEALVSKVAVFIPSVSIDFLAAAIASRKLEVPTPPLFKRCRCGQCASIARFIKMFFLWQMYIFVQIMIGLAGIPFTIAFLISPADITSQVAALCVILLSMIALSVQILSIQVRLPKWETFFKGCLSFLEKILVVGTLIAIFSEYLIFIEGGLAMAGIKGYIVSFSPTILLSVIIWIMKRQLFHKKSKEKAENYCKYEEEKTEEMEIPIL